MPDNHYLVALQIIDMSSIFLTQEKLKFKGLFLFFANRTRISNIQNLFIRIA